MVQVRVKEGVLEGETVENQYGGKYCSFKGVPYAQPPLGDLRFKAPQPPKPWSGVRGAKEFGPHCYQMDFFKKDAPSGSEDCLYLNVYSPDVSAAGLPVMVYIHGGGFFWGSGNDDFYGPQFLVRQGVILVTFNYRLEVLGFLSLDTEDVPGNAGMKDQVAALRWVQKNIRSFGGDPNNVTLFGESAGGASTSFHLVSPMSKGLFKRAIIQSGSANAFWAQAYEPKERAKALARKLGFVSNNDKELYEFFKSQPVESLILASVPITLTEAGKVYLHINYAIVNEKQFGNNERFFYGDIEEALRHRTNENVDLMSGFTQHEGIIILGEIPKIDDIITNANTFLEFFTPGSLTKICSLKQQVEISKKMKQFYFQNEQISRNNIDKLEKFIAADVFNYPTVQWQRLYSRKNKVYSYKFTCHSKRNVFTRVVLAHENELFKDETVCHFDDLCYIFNMQHLNDEVDIASEEFKLIDRVTKLWTNFAKYGHPTPDQSLSVVWPEYDETDQRYLEIGNQLRVAARPNNEEVELWDQIFAEYRPQSSLQSD